MRKVLKNQLAELIALLPEAHEKILESIEKNDVDTATICLSDCQNTAVAVGTKIDETEGEGTTAVKSLEAYCELLFQIHQEISTGNAEKKSIQKRLKKSFIDISNKFLYEIPDTKEVVFLPYKASMWDSLESVWKKADADPLVDAKVIPIPYYDKNPDGSFKELHYEGGQFPKDVPVVFYENYNLEKNHPDEIYIHNPYDDANYVTSVHPYFYSSNIRKFTDKLVYIPYFVLEEIDPGNKAAIEGIKHFIETPAVINAHEVIVQSENMRKAYVECMVNLTGEENREYFEQKIKGTGSPKIEKIKSMTIDDVEMPMEWKKYIYRNDGSRKKIIIYNTSVGTLLQESEQMLRKMLDVFRIFKEHRNEVTLLWRPHPLIKATICSMRPQLYAAYEKIVERYKSEDFGIYDDTADMDRALVMADAYYGDQSSLVTLCKAIGMPIMIQNAHVIEEE
ncbi:hypothetical protein [Oribacterium sp. WCC10]|uniref:hypothetical protein n=1 Tax=Oribacterium sp. WCC10 TaxID=1855343 RepID=UPI0008DED264|nr:hypothetical protein [Oribacterium sp. WCC10]SFG25770.1 hypothetical protein SAMN05216356_104113 [Oribacterium sp. WCC10]